MEFNSTNYPIVTPAGEDLVLLRQNSSGVVKTALVSALANAASPISLAATVALLKAIPTSNLSDGASAVLAGYYASNDGGGGQFYWDQSSIAGDNGGTVIAPNDGVGRWIRAGTNNVYNAAWFGVVGNGVSNDTAALQRALNALASVGGSVDIGGLTVRTTGVDVPIGVSIIGSLVNPDPRNPALLSSITDVVLLDGPAATITLHETSGFTGAKILPYGMTFPQNAAAVANWTGTAVTIAAGAHAAYVGHAAIVGFARASNMSTSSFVEQTTFENVAIDCLAGIKIVSGTDRITLNKVECWPTASIGLSSPTDADLRRPGIAFELDALIAIDAPNLTNCFAYAYATGFRLNSVNGAAMLNCVADYTPTKLASITGALIEGDTAVTSLTNCKFYRSTRGVEFSPNQPVHYLLASGCSFEFIDAEGIYADNGGGSIIGNIFSGMSTIVTTYGIRAHNCPGASRFVVDGNHFNYTTNAYAMTGTTAGNVIVAGANVVTGNGTNLFLGGGLASYASASTVTIPGDTNVFFVTGNVAIDNFSVAQAYGGREITVIFTGTPTVNNSAGLKLAGAANFVATANDVLKLTWSGSAWYESGRSVN